MGSVACCNAYAYTSSRRVGDMQAALRSASGVGPTLATACAWEQPSHSHNERL
jgi:hypothetical protein